MTSIPADAEPHVRAVQAVLETGLALLPTAIHAYIGTRPDNDHTCVVIHGSTGDLSGSLGDRYANLTVPIQLTAVGTGPEQAMAYADSARKILLGAALTVTGRRVRPAVYVAGQPALRDDQVQPPLWIATAQYAITSEPA